MSQVYSLIKNNKNRKCQRGDCHKYCKKNVLELMSLQQEGTMERHQKSIRLRHI